jgi:photosystem II stability/assembly factor-like uncharacterized protein
MMRRRYFNAALVGIGSAMASFTKNSWAFVNPLDQAAMPSLLATRSIIHAVTTAGERIVAVGVRGHIVTSDDSGKTWKQSKVPVSSDLLAVSFATSTKGWVVGHGGVVLHSDDGGLTWTKQFDGRQAGALSVKYFERLLIDGKPVEQLLQREKNLIVEGETQALLDVYFESETHGFAVGTFNRIYRTIDGGKNWIPWMDRIENPKDLHFYAIKGGRHGIYLAGEQGSVWRYDGMRERFLAIPTPYSGTLFGLVISGPRSVLVFGMRGSLFATSDAGATWAKIATNSPAGITSGAVLSDGSVVLVNQAGGINLSRDGGKSFTAVNPAKVMPYFGIVSMGERQVALAGPEGIRIELLP